MWYNITCPISHHTDHHRCCSTASELIVVCSITDKHLLKAMTSGRPFWKMFVIDVTHTLHLQKKLGPAWQDFSCNRGNDLKNRFVWVYSSTSKGSPYRQAVLKADLESLMNFEVKSKKKMGLPVKALVRIKGTVLHHSRRRWYQQRR